MLGFQKFTVFFVSKVPGKKLKVLNKYVLKE